MGIAASGRRRRALNRQLSALATGYFTARQLNAFRKALGPDPIHRSRLFSFLDMPGLSESIQRNIVRECTHGDSEEEIAFTDFINARCALEQRYGENALAFCRRILLDASGCIDADAIALCVQFAAGGADACSLSSATSVAGAIMQPTTRANMAAEEALEDIFLRCPALLKLLQKLLSEASELPWAPPPRLYCMGESFQGVGPSQSTSLLSAERAWVIAGELEASCVAGPWLRVFRASTGGWSINRFLEAAGGLGPTLLVVRTTAGVVLGCYAPESWSQHGDLYGEEGLKAFVFQLEPEVAVYKASGHTNTVQWCCRRSSFLPNGVGIGGIQRAQALFLSEDLSSGHSRATVAFTNPPLAPASSPSDDGIVAAAADGTAVSSGEGCFAVQEVECWALQPEAVAAREQGAGGGAGKSVLEAHQKELAFLGITGRQAFSAGFREDVPEEYKEQLRV